jgi:pyruvate kinase
MPTKIIATIGPKSESFKDMRSLVKAGVDIFRVNFSHATYAQYRRIKKNLEKINKNREEKIRIIMDLQGPRIRVGRLPDEGRELKSGEKLSLQYVARPAANIGEIIPIDHPDLHKYLKINDVIFLANGEIEIKVLKIEKKVIFAQVIIGGFLTSHRGINLPKTNLKEGGLTKKDVKDVEFGVKNGLDYMALSFVQSAKDVKKLRKLIGNKKIKIISKIERGIALENIDQIIKQSDLIMVARGDLGIEVPYDELPIIQKNLVRHSHWYNKPAIIATQVMTSMIDNSHPTRAEVSDIANAVLDGADMIMLSDETAIGNHASKAVKILKKVIDKTSHYLYKTNVMKY